MYCLNRGYLISTVVFGIVPRLPGNEGTHDKKLVIYTIGVYLHERVPTRILAHVRSQASFYLRKFMANMRNINR